jgi:hypothetical protein
MVDVFMGSGDVIQRIPGSNRNTQRPLARGRRQVGSRLYTAHHATGADPADHFYAPSRPDSVSDDAVEDVGVCAGELADGHGPSSGE